MKRAVPYILVATGAVLTMIGIQILLGNRPGRTKK